MAETSNGGGPPEPPKKKRWYLKPSVLYTAGALVTAGSIYGGITSWLDKRDAQAKLKAQFDNKKTELRNKFLDKLKTNPTQNVEGVACRYGEELQTYADAMSQSKFNLVEDVGTFTDELEDVQRKMSVPVARRARYNAQVDFDTYVEQAAIKMAGLFELGMPESEKTSLVATKYKEILEEANRSRAMGVEEPELDQFIDLVSYFFDYEAGLQDIARSAPRDKLFERFLGHELAADQGFVCDAEHLSELFLKMYNQQLRDYIQDQTEKLMDETDADRQNTLNGLGTTFDEARDNRANALNE